MDDGTTAVMKMRDEFLAAVTAFNAVGAFKSAMEAQAVAVAIHEFEDKTNVTYAAWPLRAVTIEGELMLADADEPLAEQSSQSSADSQ